MSVERNIKTIQALIKTGEKYGYKFNIEIAHGLGRS